MHPAAQLLARLFIAAIAAVPLTAGAAAAPGALDRSFGSSGIVTTALAGEYLEAHALAVQADGRIVIAGQACRSAGGDCDLAVERLNKDGSLDTTFNNSGAVPGLLTLDIKGNDDHAQAVEVTTEGLIVVSGYTCVAVDQCDFLLIRLLPNGSYDTTFGNSGIIDPGLYGTTGQALALALQPDGKMVMGGFANTTGNDDFTLMRYYADTPDLGFAQGGIVNTDFSGGDDQVNALALQPDGMIVAAGQTCVPGSTNCRFAVVRLNTSGAPDYDGFNATLGHTTLPIGSGGDDRADAVTLQPDGKIVVAGQACTLSHSSCAFAVVRYNADGTLDTADGQGNPGFNGTGIALVNIGSGVAIPRAVLWQPDGKIVVAGYSNNGSNDIALLRLAADGAVDAGFGTNGIVTTDLGGGDEAYALALQPDGKLVVAGGSTGNNTESIAVVRYIAQDPAWNLSPQTFHFNSLSDVPVSSVQTSNLITVSGLDADVSVPVAVLNGSYAKVDSSSGAYTYTKAQGWARQGDQFSVSQISSTAGGQTASAGLLIGGITSPTNPAVVLGTPASATFSVTTALIAPPGGGALGPLGCLMLGVLAAWRRCRPAHGMRRM